MSYVVEYEPEALADLEKLTQAVLERVVNKKDKDYPLCLQATIAQIGN